MATSNLALTNDFAAGNVLPSSWLNDIADLVEALFYGRASITHDDSANYDPEAASAGSTRYPVLIIGGTLTAARNLIVPTINGSRWLVVNATAGGFAVTVKTSGGSGISVPASTQTQVRGDGTNIVRAAPQIFTGSKTWDPASIADGDDLSTTVTVPGAAVGDPAFAGLSTIGTNDVLITAHVEATDTVRVILLNRRGSSYDIGSGTLTAGVLKGI